MTMDQSGSMSTPDPHLLLEHAGFLRALALGLLRDESAADDILAQRIPDPRQHIVLYCG